MTVTSGITTGRHGASKRKETVINAEMEPD